MTMMMRGVCAWCGRDLQIDTPTQLAGVSHGICGECFLELRVRETLKRLQPGAGPYPLFVPPDREDLVLRIQREAPPGCSFIIHTDRRRGDRRAQRVAASADRRTGRDRRRGTLSFLPSHLPGAPPPS